MADHENTINNRIVVTGTEKVIQDVDEIKKHLKDLASTNVSKEISKGFQEVAAAIGGIGTVADEVKKKLSSIKTVEQQLEQQISRTKRAYQLSQDDDAIEKLAKRRKIDIEKAQEIYSKAFESRANKLSGITEKIMSNDIALGNTYSKNISLLQQSARILDLAGLKTKDLTLYTKELREEQRKVNLETKPDKIPNIQVPPNILSLAMERSNINQRWEKNYLDYYGKNMTKYAENAAQLRKEAAEVSTKIEQMGSAFEVAGNKAGYLGSFLQKLRSHTNWLLSGMLLSGTIALPTILLDVTKEIEVLNTKIKQNLELAERYHNNSQQLEQDIKHLGEVASVFAMGYGADLKEVMEIQQILSRRFKSPEELTYYTNLAMIMHKLDFVSPRQSAENLEAVVLSMGLDFKQARQFIDEFSIAVHTARITGTDLLMALQRSGSTFKNMNMNTAEAIAMVSTLSTVVAKSGENIGVSLNSLLTNIDFKKAKDALHAYKIEVYDDDGKMRKGVDIWRDIARVFNGLDEQHANEFALAMSGGELKLAA